MNKPEFIQPAWPAPENITAGTTLAITNKIDVHNPFGSFNLADHVGDDSEKVMRNRNILYHLISNKLGSNDIEFNWLNQTHSNNVIQFDNKADADNADAIISQTAGQVCAVLTADCLPILLCSHDGTTVAAIHAGWRGLANGIINKTIEKINQLDVESKKLYAWLGPAIGPNAFEVGEDVLNSFISNSKYFSEKQSLIEDCFSNTTSNSSEGDQKKYLADLYQLATLTLKESGLHHIYGGGFCTQSENRFYSYRRQHQTGRMATFIARN